MIFKRKRIRERSAKIYKEWYETRQYRITWQNLVAGVSVVTPAYYACVRCVRSDFEYWWDSVGRRGTYRTLPSRIVN